MKIVLATHNKGKIREFREALAEIGWEAEPISEVADLPDPDETGATFEENALQKARYYSAAIHAPVLSDDSGIVADALNGRPGIYSARYAGKHGDDEANNQKLIRELAPYSGEERKGRYVCAVALVWPDGRRRRLRGDHPRFLRGDRRIRLRSALLPAGIRKDHGGAFTGRKERHQPPGTRAAGADRKTERGKIRPSAA